MPERLSSSVIQAMQPPGNGNAVIWDSGVTGLGARVTAAGNRSFVFRYVHNGRERRMTLGPFPALSVSAAREIATQHRAAVARGVDPLADRQNARKAPTVADLCKDYIDRHAKRHKRPGSVKDDESMIDSIIKPRLGKRRVADLEPRDVENIHHAMRGTPYRANRCLALISKMLSLAIKWGWRENNPARGISRFPEERRERWLDINEITRLADALDKLQDRPAANAIRLLLLTGSRKSEVLKMRWTEIDFATATWTKPSAHTKQKRQERVPLSPPALSLLQRIKESQASKAIVFVFPGDSEEGNLTDIKKTWQKVCLDAGLYVEHPKTTKAGKPLLDHDGQPVIVKQPTARIHDLRHTFASHLVSSGRSLPLVGRLLGHTQPATTARYAHLADDPLREAVGAFGVIAGRSPTAPPAGGEVVPMPTPAKART